jgi:tRNA (cmo5U34)-methyltransferase
LEKGSAKDINIWNSTDHASAYLSKRKGLPHRGESIEALLEQIPTDARRILDLGTGDGRLMALIKQKNPNVEGICLDFSEPMLKLAEKRFEKDKKIQVLKHDFRNPLPSSELGYFDVIVSGLAIHHLVHERKKQLFKEIFDLLYKGGVFCNLEHVASSTVSLHNKFLARVGLTPVTDDPSNKLLDVETQLIWLREIGFIDADCSWKWLEIALLTGFKPSEKKSRVLEMN